MNSIRRCTCNAAFVTLCLAGASAGYGQTINGYYANPRVFNDDPGSTLTITPPSPINSNPATITIHDQYSGAFSGANRSDVSASVDGGASAYTFGIDDSFTFTTRLTLTDGFNSPRKEAGIRINSSAASGVGDMQFFVNSDAGEIVALGGGAPFYLFGKNSNTNGYTPGTSILLGIKETGGGDGIGGTANTIEFFIDRGFGIETTGPLAWSNTEGGPVDFNLGVYAQGGANASGDFINAVFADTTFTAAAVPEPGVFALLGVGLFGVLTFRRKR